MNRHSVKAPCILRAPVAGDIGWIVHRHGALYAAEYGWNAKFEGLVAEVAGRFLRERDPARERCWVAEYDGSIAGSIFLMNGENAFAKLRLLYVEPSARGLGIGQLLVSTCVGTARELGYAGMTLWTTSELHAARRLYEAAGFRLAAEDEFDTFGPLLKGQTWTLAFT